ncbi:kinesin-like protein KIF6 [Erpetoichthys calabaricus]|uniref:kinesin-like protein KIF6 n=1 Tax=Erpetoichthys calabaricus TaxID=27687 RepID=UPI00223460C8|nr:kinesin-like protein KIF6 [Erpetoichthys calabaricus]
MVKQTIQIFARVKPTKKPLGVYSADNEEPGSSSLEFLVPRDLADGFINNKRESYRFRFQKVFDQAAKQEDIFEEIARPVADSVLSGYNGTIFAYGQTGSGKTFTITGGAERYGDRGIIPRTLSYLFQQFDKDTSKVYSARISYLEIYNENGYDLLDPRHEAAKLEDLPKVTIMEDTEQNIHLKNLSSLQAANEEDALNLLFLGDTNRMIAETPMNQASTRSHCIFTVHISSREPGSATVRRSKLHLVDLAGSERVAKTGVGGHLLTEAKYINLSLHYLEQVIIALSEKNRSHIPYRNSMMTSVLRDSLGGNCMTSMIATVSADKKNIDESISTCRFAQRVALIKNEAVLNEELDPALMIARLKREVQELKDELALVTGEQRTEQLTEEELQKLEEQIKTFLEDGDPEASLKVGVDMRKIHHCFQRLKVYAKEKTVPSAVGDHGDSHAAPQDELPPDEVKLSRLVKLEELLQQRDNEISILVNMLKKEKKRAQDAINQVSAGSKEVSATKNPTPPPTGIQTGESVTTESKRRPLHLKTGAALSLGRQEAFEIFARDHVDSITFEDNKAILRLRIAEAKSLGENLKTARSRINELKQQMEQRRLQRAALGMTSNDGEHLVESDPMEEELRDKIEEEKKSYKAIHGRLKSLKTEIEHLQLLQYKAKAKLQKDFEGWWADEAARLQAQEQRSASSSSDRLASSVPLSSSSSSLDSLHKFRNPNPGHTREASLRSSSDSRVASALSGGRPPGVPGSAIPLTGNPLVDADIVAFVKARQTIHQRIGLQNK